MILEEVYQHLMRDLALPLQLFLKYKNTKSSQIEIFIQYRVREKNFLSTNTSVSQ